MKRSIFLIFVLFCMSFVSNAQNANRKGFFVEAGFGGLVGNSIRSSVKITNNTLQYKCLAGSLVEIGLGGRFRSGNHWAYEFKLGCQTNLSEPVYGMCFRILPVGFRYTSIEIWRNISLFSHFNVGTTIGLNNGKMPRVIPTLFPETPFIDIEESTSCGVGLGYSLGIGANLTNHCYLELCYNAQALFNSIGNKGKGTVNGGLLGVSIGYRF